MMKQHHLDEHSILAEPSCEQILIPNSDSFAFHCMASAS